MSAVRPSYRSVLLRLRVSEKERLDRLVPGRERTALIRRLLSAELDRIEREGSTSAA